MFRTSAVSLFAALLAGAGFSVQAAPVRHPHQTVRPAPAPASPVPAMAYTYRQLPNGLKVYALRDPNTPNVSVQVWYQVGGRDDPKGRSGFAHLFEHLMFKATKNLPPESFDRLTEDVGGSNNASTHADFTEYHEVIPANYLQLILWAEAERMGALVVDEASFKSERSVVEEELRQSVLSQPYGRLFYLYSPEVSFQVSPYGRPVIGSIGDLDAASLADVQAFHALWYRPDNAVLVVAGNFDPAQLDRWVDDYFGRLKRPAWPIPPHPAAVEPRRTAPRIWTAYAPNVPLPAVLVSFPEPPAASPDTAALQVADTVLSGGDSSRLHQALIYRQQIATDAFTVFEPYKDAAAYSAGVILAKGVQPAKAEASLLAEVAGMQTKPPTAEELARAKHQLVTALLTQRQAAEGKAAELAEAAVIYGDASEVNRSVAEIEKVTAADVVRVTRKYWNTATRAEVRYLSDAQAPKGAREPGVSPTIQTVALEPPSGAPTFELAPADQREKPPAPGAPVPFHPPTPSERTLANGLRVVVAENHGLPLVTADLIVGEGAAADPAARPGTAWMTADLVTKGANGMSAPQIARAIESLGGSLDSGAASDSSNLSMTVERNALAKAMPIFADVARKPTFAAEELDRERKQALNDLEVSLSQPRSLAAFARDRAVYGAAPYGAPAAGGPRSLAEMTRQDAAAFHAAWWRPDEATLVLSGDVTPEQGFQIAQRWFGDWARPATPPPAVPPPAGAERPKPRVIVVDMPGSGQAAVSVARLGLERRDPRFYEAQVANEILGGGYSSRLNQEIRIKRGLSYGASSAFFFRRAPGPFVASAQTKNASAPEVVDLILENLKGMAATPTSASELKARQSALIGNFGRATETTAGAASLAGGLALYGVDLAELSRYTDKVAAVTPEQVQALAAKTLDPAAASIVVVGDAKEFLDELKAKFPNVEVIPAADLDIESPTLRKGARRSGGA